MSAKHLWSTGSVIQSRFCRSQCSMCWVQCVLQDAGIVLHLVVAALTAWTSVRTFLNLRVGAASGSRSTFHFRVVLQVSHWRTRAVAAFRQSYGLVVFVTRKWPITICCIYGEQNGAFRYAMCFVILIIYCCVMTKWPFIAYVVTNHFGWVEFSFCACYRRVYFGPAAFDSTESFELFLHAVSELLRRFLDVPDLWVVVLRLVGGAPVPIHELWHIVLPCYSCLSCMAVSHLWSVKVMSAKHLWSTGSVIQSRFCRSQCSMCWVQCVLQDAGVVLHLVVAALTAWTNVRTFLNLQVWCCIWQSEHIPF